MYLRLRGVSAWPPLDRAIVSCVRAGEAKLCERLSENDYLNAGENSLEISASFVVCSFSSAYGLLCVTWVVRTLAHVCCYMHVFAQTVR